ncbi:MAG: sigma-70 family RNA polymerase sigma factor [Pirellulales bacterium]|nr:sigma-70 family RNA polymerase sigma factor [Pirellulales bacterium]
MNASHPHDESREARTQRFMALFTQYQRHVYYFIRSLIPNPTDAEEVLQQVNLILWQKFDEFEEGTNFRAWACRIARFEVFNFRARQNAERLRFSDEFLAKVADSATRNADTLDTAMDAMFGCLDELKPEDRKLIERRYQPGMTSGRLATELGRPVESVYKSLSRIRRSLVACVRRVLRQQEAR